MPAEVGAGARKAFIAKVELAEKASPVAVGEDETFAALGVETLAPREFVFATGAFGRAEHAEGVIALATDRYIAEVASVTFDMNFAFTE